MPTLCRAFVAAFVGFLAAQGAKVFTHYYVQREWDFTRLVGSGGMPSSHTSLVMGLTAAMAVLHGTSNSMFAICLVFSLIVSVSSACVPRPALAPTCVLRVLPLKHPSSLASVACSPRPRSRRAVQVMYDATGVRAHAGKQASVLNMIITELPPDHPVSSAGGQLKEVLGHTPLQVAVGAVLGVVIGYIVGLLYSL